MVGENIWEKMYLNVRGNLSQKETAYLVASAADRRSSPSAVFRTRKITTRKGTASEVTNRGIA